MRTHDLMHCSQALLLMIAIMAHISTIYGQDQNKTVSLFDGISFHGWNTIRDDELSFWKIADSTIIGGDGATKIPYNTFLYTDEKYSDFEFQCMFKITGEEHTGMINSGIQYRSVIEDGKMIGYQADIGKGYWGDLYDEHRRGELKKGNLDGLQQFLNEEGWNSYMIRCVGNRHQLYINGFMTTEYVEIDPQIPSSGVIALQVHSGGNTKVEFKNILLKRF